MNTVVIIQARMGSTRLPGKIMADITGKPMLWHVIERVKKAQKIDQIVLATTKNEEDHKTACLAKECGVELYRGSQNDVLDRYFHAANQYKAELIVRITADCPLIDPHVIDKMVDYHYQHEDLDYISMGNPNPCPDGLDTEVFTFQSLDKAFREARLPSEREHVTPYIWKNTEKFKLGYVFDQKTDLSHLRWTVDEEPDLKFVREVYKRLYHEGEIFVTHDVLELLKHEPKLMEINQGIMRNEGYLKSISED
ncbi:cytidylyltransferase domain-containing protein [Methanobacterium formicicum]|uniref:Acylneuraminate cytidylyltransferase n=1 Tax=Methanobacterium formicicum (strain DSM 3637 / PP1) TaxID=1204725 RepID=K2QDD3_METFP|nr:glycosyltransferase family protein [Methanobacterium formicicum]EKF86036.1 acylneuraminate cytidylyltransferase [Methanobacterium formicicum DSM 3637]